MFLLKIHSKNLSFLAIFDSKFFRHLTNKNIHISNIGASNGCWNLLKYFIHLVVIDLMRNYNYDYDYQVKMKWNFKILNYMMMMIKLITKNVNHGNTWTWTFVDHIFEYVCVGERAREKLEWFDEMKTNKQTINTPISLHRGDKMM